MPGKSKLFDREGEEKRLLRVFSEYMRSTDARKRWDPANRGNQQIIFERSKAIHDILEQFGFMPLDNRRILDVGCGSGGVLAGLQKFGAEPENLYGVDLHPYCIENAQRTYPSIHFECCNAERLKFSDGEFDLVLLFTVLSSILSIDMADNLAREVCRVLKPKGAILWYDFRYDNPWNPHVRGLPKPAIRNLFPGFMADVHTLTLVPILARRLGRLTPMLYPILAGIPFLRTHYLGILLKPAAEIEHWKRGHVSFFFILAHL